MSNPLNRALFIELSLVHLDPDKVFRQKETCWPTLAQERTREDKNSSGKKDVSGMICSKKNNDSCHN
jgi:hypothetical protein